MKIVNEIVSLVLPAYFVLIFFSTLAALLLLSGSAIPYTKFILLCLALCFMVFAFNASNMVFDKGIDSINKPSRPVPAGRIRERNVIAMAALLYLGAMLIGFFIGTRTLLVLFSFSIVSLLYSIPPVRLKANSAGSNFVGAFLYGSVPVLAAWSIFEGLHFPVGIIFLFTGLTFGFVTSKDFEDVHGDLRYEIRTLPVMFGIEKAIGISVAVVFGVLLVFLVFSAVGIFSKIFVVPALVSFFLLLFPAKKVFNFIKISNFVKLNLGKDLMTQSNLVIQAIVILLAIEMSFGLWSVYI